MSDILLSPNGVLHPGFLFGGGRGHGFFPCGRHSASPIEANEAVARRIVSASSFSSHVRTLPPVHCFRYLQLKGPHLFVVDASAPPPPPFSPRTQAPKFLTIQVSRTVLNDTIGNLNAYAAPRLASPSELLLTVDEIMAIIDQGELSRTLLLSAAHLKRIEVRSSS